MISLSSSVKCFSGNRGGPMSILEYNDVNSLQAGTAPKRNNEATQKGIAKTSMIERSGGNN